MNFLEVRKSIIRDEISPSLKTLGFRKKGNNFTFDSGPFIKVFSVENSSWNSSDFVSFSLTTGILFPRIYKLRNREKNLQNLLSARSCHFIVNTHQICNELELYELSESTDIELFTKRIQSAMKDVVNYFASINNAQDCVGLIEKYHSSRYDIRSFIGLELLEIGDVKNGLKLVGTLESSSYVEDFKAKIYEERDRLLSKIVNRRTK